MAERQGPVTFLGHERVPLREDTTDCLNRFVVVSFVDVRAAVTLKWTLFFPALIVCCDFRCYFSVAFLSVAQVSQTVNTILLADHGQTLQRDYRCVVNICTFILSIKQSQTKNSFLHCFVHSN